MCMCRGGGRGCPTWDANRAIGYLIDGLARAVKDATKHVLGHRGRKNVAGEFDGGALVVDARSALEHLHDSLGALYLQDLASSRGPVRKLKVHDLGELGRTNILCAARNPLATTLHPLTATDTAN